MKINFEKHVAGATTGSGGLGGAQSRMGNCDDAFELLSILTSDHRNDDDDDDPLEAEDLLNGNKACIDLFNKWLQKQSADHV